MSRNQHGDDVTEEYNPFQAPKSTDEAGSYAGSHVEVVRRAHLSHEASIKSVSSLYFLGGGLTLLGLLWGLGFTISGGPGSSLSGSMDLAVFILPFVLAVLQLVTAVGLRRLRPWATITSGILSALSLFWVPMGTIMGAYILYLLFSAKGRMVFSNEYKDVIQQTPHIVYKTSILIWSFLVLLFSLLGVALTAVYFR